jgi:hypothetical protein
MEDQSQDEEVNIETILLTDYIKMFSLIILLTDAELPV